MLVISPLHGENEVMYRRNIVHRVASALADTRVVLLSGARQVGKSTLAEALARQRGGKYFSLDDPAVADLARTDPSALVQSAGDFTVIDEVQAAPALFPVLKREVDRRPEPGRFLLTGSANVFMLPKVAESLAGRMEVVTLEPLSQAEIKRSENNLVDALFAEAPWAPGAVATDRADLLRRCQRRITFPHFRRSKFPHPVAVSVLSRSLMRLAPFEAGPAGV
jgi:uncharacterized protein